MSGSADSALLTAGPHHRETEFVNGLTGACGPNSCAMAEWNATGKETHTYDVYSRMRTQGLCDPNGASNSLQWAAYFRSRGLPLFAAHSYAGDVWSGWQPFLEAAAGKAAVVLELANGQALRDAVSGQGENAVNLHYHIICVYGTGTYNGESGVWCADGDNFAAGDVLQFYSWAVLAAALPCAAVAIAAEVSMIPAGWTDDGTTLTAPNGKTVVHGFRDWVLAHTWADWDWPLDGETGLPSVELGNPQIGTGTRQVFRSCALGWTQARGVYAMWTGQELLAWMDALGAANAKIAQLEAQPPAPPVVQSNPQEHAKAAALDGLMALYGVHSA